MNDAKRILRDAWDSHEGPIVLTTADEKGIPNAIYATFVKLLDDGRIVVADNYFNKTRANIKRGSKGSVAVPDEGTKILSGQGQH